MSTLKAKTFFQLCEDYEREKQLTEFKGKDFLQWSEQWWNLHGYNFMLTNDLFCGFAVFPKKAVKVSHETYQSLHGTDHGKT